MCEGRGIYRYLVGRPDGKRSLRRPRRRWEGKIKMDVNELVLTGFGWLRIGSSGGHL
jgi:hypothetical protein